MRGGNRARAWVAGAVTAAVAGAAVLSGGGPGALRVGRAYAAPRAAPRSAAQVAPRSAARAVVLDTEPPAALVDPFVGTGSGGRWVGRINAFPGASAPFGMVQWSPDTTSRPQGGGYDYADSALTGFSLTHLSGPGCPVAGDVPFLPVAGDVPAAPERATAQFRHDSESARPGYYAVTAGQVRTELSTTVRTGIARFHYPRGRAAHLLVKVDGGATRDSDGLVRAVGDREITGQVTSGGFCGSRNRYTIYFAARFDRPIGAVDQWPGTTAGATLSFDPDADGTVRMKSAVSYVSADGALGNLEAEADSWDLDQVAAREQDRWNRQLASVTVAGGTRDQRSTFYTALYHSLLHPGVFNDADGRYPGFDGQVHRTAPGHTQYADFSGWDIYRCEMPLLAMTVPDRADDMATSLLNDADQGGWLPKWPVANGYTAEMSGDAADPVLADVYAFGDHGFDARSALRLMVHGAEDPPQPPGQGWYIERPWGAEYLTRGYVPSTVPAPAPGAPTGRAPADRAPTDTAPPGPPPPAAIRHSASTTLEYAAADFAVSRLAAELGDGDTAQRFRTRSHNWANLFDPATGYIRPRDADGAFPAGPPVDVRDGHEQSGFAEGNAAQYTWMVTQDLPALIAAVGGPGAATARLDTYFTQLNAGPGRPYHWQGNEPGFATPWIYDSTGRPDRTQAVVRSIMDQLYSPTPGGEPGNDDLGAMSSWYVWAALGLYPETAGAPLLALSTPLFPRAVVHRPGRPDLVLTTTGSGRFVSALARDGVPSTRTWIDPVRTGRLDFTLAAAPDPGWGTDPADAPPVLG